MKAEEGMRANALWGGGGKRISVLLVVLAIAAAAMLGVARPAHADREPAYTSPGLLEEAAANPRALFNVIVQAAPGRRSQDAAEEVTEAKTLAPDSNASLRRRFNSIRWTSATSDAIHRML